MAQFANTTTESMTNLFSSTSIEFEGKDFPSDITNIQGAKFGIASFTASAVPISKTKKHIHFEVDCSGSMSDICKDGKTKMEQVNHTLENMVHFIAETDGTNVSISVSAFDNIIYKIIDPVNVTCANVLELVQKIKTIRSRQMTNIQLAIEDGNKICLDYKALNPDAEVYMLLLTDGSANEGLVEPHDLKALVNTSFSNSFIGFGVGHNFSIMNALGSCIDSNYYFIDALENAGLVYGEILHGILFKVLQKVSLHVENALVYDYKTNLWADSLYIGSVVGEKSKTFHLLSHHPELASVSVTGVSLSDDISSTHSLCNLKLDADLTKYVFRQRNMQLLFEVKTDNLQNKSLKKKLKDLLAEMKEWMKTNDMENDTFMKNLCDDCYISYKTFGTEYANMFATARHTGQTQQREYSNRGDDVLLLRQNAGPCRQNAFNFNGIQRQNAVNSYDYNNNDDDDDEEDVEDDALQHQVSDGLLSPFATRGCSAVMRSCSNGPATSTIDDVEDPVERL